MEQTVHPDSRYRPSLADAVARILEELQPGESAMLMKMLHDHTKAGVSFAIIGWEGINKRATFRVDQADVGAHCLLGCQADARRGLSPIADDK